MINAKCARKLAKRSCDQHYKLTQQNIEKLVKMAIKDGGLSASIRVPKNEKESISKWLNKLGYKQRWQEPIGSDDVVIIEW